MHPHARGKKQQAPALDTHRAPRIAGRGKRPLIRARAEQMARDAAGLDRQSRGLQYRAPGRDLCACDPLLGPRVALTIAAGLINALGVPVAVVAETVAASLAFSRCVYLGRSTRPAGRSSRCCGAPEGASTGLQSWAVGWRVQTTRTWSANGFEASPECHRRPHCALTCINKRASPRPK